MTSHGGLDTSFWLTTLLFVVVVVIYFKVAPSFWFLNINVLIFCCNSFKIISGGRGSNFVAVHRQNVDQIAYLFLYVMLLEKVVFFFFEKEISKWPVTPTFFSKNVFSWTRSSGRVKKTGMLMFKIPDFSLAPRLCKQAGLDLVSARKVFNPRTLVSGDFRPIDTTVRCAAHYAGATLRGLSSRKGLIGGLSSTVQEKKDNRK